MSALLIDCTIALRWRDLDAYNHVNNSVFLTLLEQARIHWFESLGGPWRTRESEPLLASVTVNYRRPIPYPETLRIRLHAERCGRSSLTIGHMIGAAANEDTVYADGHAVLVWVAPDSGRPIPLPDCVRASAGGVVG